MGFAFIFVDIGAFVEHAFEFIEHFVEGFVEVFGAFGGVEVVAADFDVAFGSELGS